ncbi:MAG: YihY/virulence factor BrkB family protein [Bacteroidales bacterium]
MGKTVLYRSLKKKFEKIQEKTKKVTFPGFYKHSIYDVVRFFINGLQKGSLTTRASSVAFNFVLAMFPGIIFLFTLIPYIPIPNFQSELLQIFENTIPETAYQFLEETLEDIILEKKWGLLSFGAIFSLFFAMNGIHALIGAFNATYHDIETRSWMTQRLISIALVFIISTLVTTAIFLIVASRGILDLIVENGLIEGRTTYYLILMGRWIITILFHLIAISFLYYLAPAKKRHWRFISPGSIMATFLSIMASLIFSFIINNFGQFNNLYGSIGTLMVAMLWTYFNSLALIIGFELNASISNVQLKLPNHDKQNSKHKKRIPWQTTVKGEHSS